LVAKQEKVISDLPNRSSSTDEHALVDEVGLPASIRRLASDLLGPGTVMSPIEDLIEIHTHEVTRLLSNNIRAPKLPAIRLWGASQARFIKSLGSSANEWKVAL
jgi:hypothetical protein